MVTLLLSWMAIYGLRVAMRVNTAAFALLLVFGVDSEAHADSFGSGGNQFNIDFVDVGDAGNAYDSGGIGSVDSAFRMGTYEVSGDMIAKANAQGALSLSGYGIGGANRPVTSISWHQAARFVNWLNESNGHHVAYKFTTQPSDNGYDSTEISSPWNVSDAGYDAGNTLRNSRAHYFLPDKNEWYKAAFYDPSANSGAGGYWSYATGDSAIVPVSGGTDEGMIVYYGGKSQNTGPAAITNAGGLSAYGTMAQNGNVREWLESPTADDRLVTGGDWNGIGQDLLWTTGTSAVLATGKESSIGFRVAAVPEPASVSLAFIGLVSLLIRRKRKS